MANVNPQNVSVMVVYGCNDVRVALAAVSAYSGCGEPWVIISGGFGRLSRQEFLSSEADTFATFMKSKGVPREKLLLENQATNTGENALFSKRIIEQHQLLVSSAILVCKNIMRPRVWATTQQVWFKQHIPVPESVNNDWAVDSILLHLISPAVDWQEFNHRSSLNDCDFDDCVEHNRAMMVGEIDRLKHYPRLGYQTSIKIPENVLQAQQFLVKKGYGKHLLSM